VSSAPRGEVESHPTGHEKQDADAVYERGAVTLAQGEPWDALYRVSE
jgi:hypothetical protein